MDRRGGSVSVTKRCVTLEDCLSTGCDDITESGHQVLPRLPGKKKQKPTSGVQKMLQPFYNVSHQVCSSCCEGNICNVLVPRNESSAVFSFASPPVSSSTRRRPAMLSIVAAVGVVTTGGRI